jgi:hypothetical protein
VLLSETSAFGIDLENRLSNSSQRGKWYPGGEFNVTGSYFFRTTSRVAERQANGFVGIGNKQLSCSKIESCDFEQ